MRMEIAVRVVLHEWGVAFLFFRFFFSFVYPKAVNIELIFFFGMSYTLYDLHSVMYIFASTNEGCTYFTTNIFVCLLI
jgi:hypothetical protein